MIENYVRSHFPFPGHRLSGKGDALQLLIALLAYEFVSCAVTCLSISCNSWRFSGCIEYISSSFNATSFASGSFNCPTVSCVIDGGRLHTPLRQAVDGRREVHQHIVHIDVNDLLFLMFGFVVHVAKIMVFRNSTKTLPQKDALNQGGFSRHLPKTGWWWGDAVTIRYPIPKRIGRHLDRHACVTALQCDSWKTRYTETKRIFIFIYVYINISCFLRLGKPYFELSHCHASRFFYAPKKISNFWKKVAEKFDTRKLSVVSLQCISNSYLTPT